MKDQRKYSSYSNYHLYYHMYFSLFLDPLIVCYHLNQPLDQVCHYQIAFFMVISAPYYHQMHLHNSTIYDYEEESIYGTYNTIFFPFSNQMERVSLLQYGQANFPLVLHPDKFSYAGKSLMVHNKDACDKICLEDASKVFIPILIIPLISPSKVGDKYQLHLWDYQGLE